MSYTHEGNVPNGLLGEPLALRDDVELMPAIMSTETEAGEQLAVRLGAQATVDGRSQYEENTIIVAENGEPADGFTAEDVLIITVLAQRLRADANPNGLWPDLSTRLSDIKRRPLPHSAVNRRV